jgi:abequosyltransferase
MNEIRLSICMPTRNYGSYIGAAIESVLNQIESDVEIVVLDSGSADSTREIVEGYAARQTCVRYFYQQEPGGIDRDMARSVELAAGKYCWLLSADDALAPGALKRILAAFAEGGELLLANRWWCDDHLKPLRIDPWLASESENRVFDLTNDKDAAAYLESARSMGALFSFMSCIGFRRVCWCDAPVDASVSGTHYAHIQRLFAMARSGINLTYLADPLILCRGGSDSFRTGGLAARLLIDLRGILAISKSVFPYDLALQRAFCGVLKREHPLRRWVRAYREAPDLKLWSDIDQLLEVFGYSLLARQLIRGAGALLRLG